MSTAAFEKAKPKRRWFQFSLRTFLVFIAVIGIGCDALQHACGLRNDIPYERCARTSQPSAKIYEIGLSLSSDTIQLSQNAQNVFHRIAA